MAARILQKQASTGFQTPSATNARSLAGSATRSNAQAPAQVDVKFIEPIGQQARKKRYDQYTAIDDCTRLRVLRTYPCNDQNTAIAFMDHIRSKLPFAADQIQTDKDQESAPSSTGTYRVMNRHIRPSATA